MSNNQSSKDTMRKILDRNMDTAYRICYTFLKNRTDIKTVVAQVLRKRVQTRIRFRDSKDEISWIVTTGEDLSREYLRDERDQLDSGTLERVVFFPDKNIKNPVISAVHCLPRDVKSIVYLYYFEGFSTMEIAKYLKLRPSTVHNRLSEARMDLNMTRQNVREAYDAVSLSEEDIKEIQDSVIEDVLDGKSEDVSDSEPLLQSKKSLLLIGVILVLIFVVGAVFYSMTARSTSEPKPLPTIPYTEPQKASVNLPMQYREVINNVIAAKQQNWTAEQYYESGVSYLYAKQDDLSQIGYAQIDLDGNGIEELFLTDGNVIFDLYTLIDGEAVHIFSGSDRNSYRLCKDNYIFRFMTDDAQWKEYDLFWLHGADLIQEQVVVFDAAADPASPWFVGFGREQKGQNAASTLIASFNPTTIKMEPLNSFANTGF